MTFSKTTKRQTGQRNDLNIVKSVTPEPRTGAEQCLKFAHDLGILHNRVQNNLNAKLTKKFADIYKLIEAIESRSIKDLHQISIQAKDNKV